MSCRLFEHVHKRGSTTNAHRNSHTQQTAKKRPLRQNSQKPWRCRTFPPVCLCAYENVLHFSRLYSPQQLPNPEFISNKMIFRLHAPTLQPVTLAAVGGVEAISAVTSTTAFHSQLSGSSQLENQAGVCH